MFNLFKTVKNKKNGSNVLNPLRERNNTPQRKTVIRAPPISMQRKSRSINRIIGNTTQLPTRKIRPSPRQTKLPYINTMRNIKHLKYMPRNYITRQLPSNRANNFVNEPIVFKHRNTNKQLKPRRLNNRRGFVKMGDGSFQEVKMSIIPPPPKLSQEELNQMRESQIVKWGPQNRNAIYRIQRNHLKKYGNNLNWYHNPPPIVRYVPSHQLGEPIMEPFSTSK
jgi:hypothetical protein